MPNTNERDALIAGPSDQEMVEAAYRITGAPQGTPKAVAFNHGARWMRDALAATAPNAGAPLPALPRPDLWVDEKGIRGYTAKIGAGPWYTAEQMRDYRAAAPAQQAGAVEQHYETQPDGTVQAIEPSQQVDPRVPERIKALAEHWAKMVEIDHADAANEAKLQHSMLVDWLAARARADAEGTRQYMRGFDDAKAQQAGAPLTLAPSEAVRNVLAERQKQDLQWGGAPHDDEHTAYDFLQFIDRQSTRARCETDPLRRQRFVKIAALAVAAIESLDRRNPATQQQATLPASAHTKDRA